MSRSFRQSYRGACLKPCRGWPQGKNRREARALKRRLAKMVDEENIPVLPQKVGRKWMGRFAWKKWASANREYRVEVRNRRLRLIRREEYADEPGRMNWREWV